MPEASGIVEKIEAVERRTKFGNKNAYYLHIDGVRYSNGFVKPEVERGDDVTVKFNLDKYGKQVYNILKNKKGDIENKTTSSTIKETALLAASNMVTRGCSIEDVICMAEEFEKYLTSSSSEDTIVSVDTSTLDELSFD